MAIIQLKKYECYVVVNMGNPFPNIHVGDVINLDGINNEMISIPVRVTNIFNNQNDRIYHVESVSPTPGIQDLAQDFVLVLPFPPYTSYLISGITDITNGGAQFF